MVTSVNGYLAILAALAAERLFELELSRRNARRALKVGAMEMGAGHYPVMAIFHALFIAAAAAEVIVFQATVPRRARSRLTNTRAEAEAVTAQQCC
jgi:methyltransferase